MSQPLLVTHAPESPAPSHLWTYGQPYKGGGKEAVEKQEGCALTGFRHQAEGLRGEVRFLRL